MEIFSSGEALCKSRVPMSQRASAFLGMSLLAMCHMCEWGCTSVAREAVTPQTAKFDVREIVLPGGTGGVALDYYAYDRGRERLWVPAGNTASVDVIDGASDKVTRIEGFRTKEFEFLGKPQLLGPTAIAIGEGVVYIGNRGDSSICIIDAKTLELGDCMPIASPAEGLEASPDGLSYIATTKELWVSRGAPTLGITAPDHSMTILDASNPKKLKTKAKLPLAGSAEGYALDERRGIFYTTLEEKSQTIAIDVRRRKIVATWKTACDEVHGLTLDAAHRFLFVACTNRVISLDAAHEGRVLGSVETGEGLDNIDFCEAKRTVYAAASRAATLTVARVDDGGNLTRIAVVPTVRGARGVVVDEEGRAYVADPAGGRILKITLQ